MGQRIVVLGAGYAGLPAAGRLGHRLRGGGAEVVVVNARPDFVERPRLHQLAAGQELRRLPLRRFLDPAGVRLVVGSVQGIDLQERTLDVDGRAVGYDTLVYAAGSAAGTSSVPGVAEHAHVLSGPDAAQELHVRVREVADGGTVLVCGGGLTGIETATELAERHPALTVVLVSPRPPGHWLSERARRHLGTAFGRLGVQVRRGRVVLLRPGTAVLDDGEQAFDVCVWAGGFGVPALARSAGLAVDPTGRVVVDEALRSVSHPDVRAIGDAAAALDRGGRVMAMGCRTGGFTGPYVADAVGNRAAGPFRFRYVHECVSLGRRDGLVQFLHADGTPRAHVLTGRAAAGYKEVVLRSAVWLFRWPGPYLPGLS
jgi:NADH dehydrogenase